MSATHITIVQRIAASGPTYRAILGNPDPTLAVTDAAAIRMRFASLGACGPDFLYALMDYGPELQDLENILVKTAATFSSMAELMTGIQERIDGVVSTITVGLSDSLKETSQTLVAVINEGLLALLAGGGVNPFAFFEARRQQDRPRTEWFWADVLHYWRTGAFVKNLVGEAKLTGNPNLIAYAAGYVTHYVTDIVGHPYVNQVVGAPWRLYWQRHHLVENFMDAYVWDRWHTPLAAAVGAAEPPLDRLVTTPNTMGTGASMMSSRLNDHVNIGDPLARDPVDEIVDDVAAQIGTLLANLGMAVNTEPQPPSNADALAWSEMFVRAMHKTYDGYMPTNLASAYLLGGKPTSRADGFPTPPDIAAAYGTFRLLLRVSTEESITDPQPPSISSDISGAIAKIAADVAAGLAALSPPPALPNGGAFSADAIIAALEQAANWAAKVATAVIEAAFDLVAETMAASGTLVVDTIKYALWLVSKALFALYRAFRDVLTLRSYMGPFKDQLAVTFGALASTSLWQSPGNPSKSAPTDPPTFPHEELLEERKVVGSAYVPTNIPSTPPELPGLDFVGPYTVTTTQTPGGPMTTFALPDAYIDAPLGPDDMFSTNGPQAPVLDGAGNPISFRDDPKNFGGAIANSKRGIDLAIGATPATFPDFNLDGDRTYAWPCWDVSPPPTRTSGGTLSAPHPLDPAANAPSMIATVFAVELK